MAIKKTKIAASNNKKFTDNNKDNKKLDNTFAN